MSMFSSRKVQSALIFITCLLLAVATGVGLWRADQAVSDERIPRGQVSGISVWVEEVEYPLNFDQQSALLSYINRCAEVEEIKMSAIHIDGVDHVSIYTFNTAPIVLAPEGMSGERIVIRVTGAPFAYLIEKEPGDWGRLLDGTYDR